MKTSLIFNPFERIAGFKALIIGASTVFLAGFIGSYTNTRFDGILNIHSSIEQSKWLYILEPIVSILAVGIWFTIICKIFTKKKFRIVDIIGTQFFAFFPIAPLAFLGLIKTFGRLTTESQKFALDHSYAMDISAIDWSIVGIVTFIILLLIVWSGALMYTGLMVSTNLKHKAVIPIFISGLIVGNIIPKLIF